MYNKAYIYNKNLEVIAIPYVLGEREFKENPAKFYPSWNRNEMYYSLVEIEQPILDNGVLREKTREELILLDNKLELLQDGEYVKVGEIIIVEASEKLIKKIWNKEKKKWEEGADLEEQKMIYKNKIDMYKAELLEKGFIFERHNQKCRDKDLALLSNAIVALEDAGGTEELSWAFSDSDIAKMSLEQLKQMRISGMNFIVAVYGVEAYLKQGEIISDLTVEKFREKVNENSEVKAV